MNELIKNIILNSQYNIKLKLFFKNGSTPELAIDKKLMQIAESQR